MVRTIHQKVRRFKLPAEEVERIVQASLDGMTEEELDTHLVPQQNYEIDQIVKGRIINIPEGTDDVLVDIGYKSEGVVPRMEFDDGGNYEVGQEIEVLLESFEENAGVMLLSKRKADRKRAWDNVIKRHREGDQVTGKVTRKIKGGLLLDIGVPAFLPASQVSLRRAGDITEFVGQELTCVIIKIDPGRMNIVVSRRKLLEDQRARLKAGLLADLEEGDTREGVVKNIVDFGAFVDLGGIDGLLHITDMSWGRVTHPSEVVSIDEKLQVKVLKVDREKERIALGLKQLAENPWNKVIDKYQIGTRHTGKVVNVMSYGAFVKLEDGIEGLVHISEMSWTRRVSHPSEMVQIDQEVDVVVLDVNRDKQEISLGMKQAESNPWDEVEAKYPPGTHIKGKVRNLTNYGAFVELEEGIDGLLHVSDMSWTRKVSNPSEMVKKGQEVEAVVLTVDTDRKRVALGVKQLGDDPWDRIIPERYVTGSRHHGTITKITNFGVFVELEENLEGLLHISELSDKRVRSPDKVVDEGQRITIEVIRLDPAERKIGLKLLADYELAEGDDPPEQPITRVIEEEDDDDAEPKAKAKAEAKAKETPDATPDTEAESAKEETPPATPDAEAESAKEETPPAAPDAEPEAKAEETPPAAPDAEPEAKAKETPPAAP